MSEWPSKDMEIAVRAERLEELQEKEEALTEKDAVIKALNEELAEMREAAERHADQQSAVVKALADALVLARKGLMQSGELEDSEWAQIDAALRLAGRLP